MNPLTWFTIVIEWHVKMLIYKVFGKNTIGFYQQQVLDFTIVQYQMILSPSYRVY